MKPPVRYLQGLDELRGVAILIVLLFHAELFPLGWTGIVLFFVLSGFLITTILLDAKQEPGYFRNFYARRALRIFPAYWLMLGLTWWVKRDFTVAGLDVAVDTRVPEWLYFITYVQNYWMPAHDFNTPLTRLLSFTWTLAVEEQFYLIWPTLVYFLGTRALLRLCFALVLAAPLLRAGILWLSGDTLTTLVALPAHFDSLALGAAVALLWRDEGLRHFVSQRAGARLLAAAGLPLAVLVASTGLENYLVPRLWMRAPGNFLFLSLASLSFAALLVMVLNGTRGVHAPLRWLPLGYLGRISYGVYLYTELAFFLVYNAYAQFVFLPLFGARIDPVHRLLLIACQIGLTLLVALASYRYLERPLLRLKERFR